SKRLAACSNKSKKARPPFAPRGISATRRPATASWRYTTRRPMTCASASINESPRFLFYNTLHGCGNSGSDGGGQALWCDAGAGSRFLANLGRRIVWSSWTQRRRQDHAVIDHLLLVGADRRIGPFVGPASDPRGSRFAPLHRHRSPGAGPLWGTF